MPEVQKYNLVDKLKEADEKYMGSTALVGKSGMTFYQHNNSSRTIMFNSHLNQFVNIYEPTFPYLFTGMENTAGKFSECYKRAKHDFEVYKKVEKFGDILDSPLKYYLFLYDHKHDKYHVVERKEFEDLTEIYGFPYVNDKIDSLKEGDDIHEGEILYHSTSMDENGNYRYGRNATTMYLLDPYSSEDAAIISESFSHKMESTEIEDITYSVNENEIPINYFGNGYEYKSIPEIGDTISGIAAVLRPQFNNRLLYDFKDKNLVNIKEGDKVIYYEGEGQVIDYEIYCNNPNLEFTDYNNQYIKYLNSQTKFWQEIHDTIKEIKKSGSKYTNNVDYLYKRSKDFIDTERKWREGDNAFSNLMIKVTVAKRVPLAKGNKFTGRYGNKSVIAEVRPDSEMPHTKDGKTVEVILNLLAIINRTTAFAPMEIYGTFILDRTREQLAKLKKRKEQEELLFDVIGLIDNDYGNEAKEIYSGLSDKEKDEYIQDCINDGIYVRIDESQADDVTVFYRLVEISKKYSWIKPYKMYVNKWGREYPMLNDACVGEMYLFRLKQSGKKGFSARSTGAINTKNLPERSYKNRTHLERTSDTAIRFGEFESLNFLIGMMPEELALFHALYRTSEQGRKDLLFSQFNDKLEMNIPKKYKSVVAEIFNVIFKSLSLEMEFGDEDNVIKGYDTEIYKEHELDGDYYICTDAEFYLIEHEAEIRKKYLKEHHIIEEEELNRLVEEEMKVARDIMAGKYDK